MLRGELARPRAPRSWRLGSGSRPTFVGTRTDEATIPTRSVASTDFYTNPITAQRRAIGRHSVIRAERAPDGNACLDGLFTTVRHSAIRA